MSGKAMEIFVYFSPAWEQLASVFQTVLTMSLYAAVVVLLVAAARFIMRKRFPAWFAYALWGIVLLRLVLPVGLLTSSFSVFNFEESIRYITGQAQREEIADKASVETMEAPVPAVDNNTSTPPSNVVTTKADEGVTVIVSVTPSPELIAAWIWAGGLILFLLFAAIAHSKTLRRLRFAVKLEKPELLAECAKQAGLRRQIQIVLSDVYNTPVVCGLFRPRIVLPPTFEDAEPDTLCAVLIHEMIHVRRLDLLWNLLGTLALAVHWFNPFVWLAAILSRRDRERSCDERTLSILGDNKQYAGALLAISAMQSGAIAPLGALAFGEEGVKGRIKAALHFKKKGRLVIVLSLASLLILGVTLASAAMPPQRLNASQAMKVILQELQTLYPDEPIPGTGLTIEEYQVNSMFEETGMQIYKITSGFRANDAFVIKDGKIVHNIRGFGGYGINSAALSDFNSDGKKELLYTSSNANGDYGMITGSTGLYDPWGRGMTERGSSVPFMRLEMVSDSEFRLIDTETGEEIGILKGSPGIDPTQIILTLPAMPEALKVSAYPNPYTQLMSSSPGMRIDVSYNALYTGVRYQAENGSFISWEDSIITELGNDVTRLNGKPVYWRPSSGGTGGDTVTVKILYDVNQPESVMAQTVLPISYDGDGWYSAGEGVAPQSSSSSGVVGGADGPTNITVDAVRTDASAQVDWNGDGNTETVEIVFKKEGPYINRTENPDDPGEQDEFPYIRTVVEGMTHELALGSDWVRQTFLYPFRLDGAKQAVAVVFDVGGTGMGNAYLHIVDFGNGLKLLPVPVRENGYLHGFDADVAFLDDYKVSVGCPETSFNGEIALTPDIYEWLIYDENSGLGMYGTDGKLLPDADMYADIDGICAVKIATVNGRECVEISQYIWGPSHAGGLGLLVTDLVWENGEYRVIDQRCEPLY